MALSRADHDNEVVTSPINATVSATSASFTPQASSLLVLTVGMHMTGNDPSTNTSVSGGGLTWSRATTQESSSGIYYGLIEIWTAPVGASPSAMTITVTNPATELYGVAHVYFQVSSFTGYDTGTPVGTKGGGNPAAGGAYSFDLPANPASTSVVIAGRFWFPGASVDTTATPGSGWTEVYDYPTPTYGYGDLETEVRDSSTSTTVSWVNLNDNAAATYFVACTAGAEIRAASGGAASTWLNTDFEQPRAPRRAIASFEQDRKLVPPIDVAGTPSIIWLTPFGMPPYRRVSIPQFHQDRKYDGPPPYVAPTVQQDAMMIFF